MGRVEPLQGYVVRDRQAVEQILAVEADLLRSEGIDPAWPDFPEDEPREGRAERPAARRASARSTPSVDPS